MESKRKVKVVGILGSSYCGSTVMNLVLNSHPDITGIGEAFAVTSIAPNLRGKARCWACGDACPVFDPTLYPIPVRDLHRKVSEVTGKTWVADTAKNAWAFREYIRARSADHYRFIVMVKDPVSAAASYASRGTFPGDTLVEPWCNIYKQALALVKGHPWILVEHGNLVEDPQGTMERIATFLGVDPLFDTVNYRDVPSHQISGNGKTRTTPRPIGPEEGVDTKNLSHTVSEAGLGKMWQTFRHLRREYAAYELALALRAKAPTNHPRRGPDKTNPGRAS